MCGETCPPEEEHNKKYDNKNYDLREERRDEMRYSDLYTCLYIIFIYAYNSSIFFFWFFFPGYNLFPLILNRCTPSTREIRKVEKER